MDLKYTHQSPLQRESVLTQKRQSDLGIRECSDAPASPRVPGVTTGKLLSEHKLILT